jgi:flagellar basal-body rod protein FlgB
MADIAQHFSVLSKALDLRTQRHQVLASNIANADTPNYKARDFEFKSAMANATAANASNGGMAITARGHQKGSSSLSGAGALQFRTESQSAADGNTVDMDVERSAITDNALQYQILTQLISNKFQGLRTAMSSTQS